MLVCYGITFVVSLVMLAACLRVDRRNNIWLRMMFLFVAVCNAGYLGLALSRSLPMALFANAVAYLGNVFMPFFILRMVMQLAHIPCPKLLTRLLLAINSVVFLVATSGGYSSIYYKEVSLEVVDGVAHLVKVYGPLHCFYKFYLLAYFAALVSIIIYTALRKTTVSTKHTSFLAIIVLGNIALWLVENIIGSRFEFLTISYLMTESLILLLYGILQDYEDFIPASHASELVYADADLPAAAAESETGLSAVQIEAVFAAWPAISTLSQREKEVLRFIFEKRKRKDIAQVLFVTESTIKKHTSNIYKKLEVTNRTELFAKAELYITK